jgi:hypothetical protein
LFIPKDDKDNLEDVTDEIRKLGRRSLSIQADVTQKDDVDDVTGPALFLASSASKFITGLTIPIDGGRSIYGDYYLNLDLFKKEQVFIHPVIKSSSTSNFNPKNKEDLSWVRYMGRDSSWNRKEESLFP